MVNDFEIVIIKLILRINILSISCVIALRRMPQDPFSDKSTSVQVMAWCRQATSHYLNQCWLRSMIPHGVTRPQWVNLAKTAHSSNPYDKLSVYKSSNHQTSINSMIIVAQEFLEFIWFRLPVQTWSWFGNLNSRFVSPMIFHSFLTLMRNIIHLIWIGSK